MSRSARTAVIGVGNDCLRDDGVGRAVIARLRERSADRPLPPDTVPATCDGHPGRLIGLWEGAGPAVVVDAAHTHPGTPGSVHRLVLDAGLLPQPSATSSHGPGLGAAVELSRVLGLLPKRLVVYAVEGADSDFGTGTGLSPAVAAALAELMDAFEKEIAACRGERS